MISIHKRVKVVAIIALIMSNYTLASDLAIAEDQRVEDSATYQSINAYLRGLDHSKRTTYLVALVNLGLTREKEAIVYLRGSRWCGSGGCNTLILARKGGSWKVISNITITRPPIYLLKEVSNGWHSIGVQVLGGDSGSGYISDLRFDGHTYPQNPTVPPSYRIVGDPVGQVIISGDETPVHLWD